MPICLVRKIYDSNFWLNVTKPDLPIPGKPPSRWRDRDARVATGAFDRALELLDLTVADPRWRDRLREIVRARELLCDAAAGGAEYGTTLEDLDRYFLAFAMAARAGR